MRVFGLLLFCFSFPGWAGLQLITQIQDVDYGKAPGDEVLVFLTSGHVAKIGQEKSFIPRLNEGKTKDRWFSITLDEKRYITQMNPASSPLLPFLEDLFAFKSRNESYIPTTVGSMEVAQKYHREGRRNPKDSQCFNRAMIWSYEWWKKNSVKSNKILIYFSRNYIRRYNFEWWFHIAPYLHVMENGKVVEKVMDLKYTSRPVDFRKWTNIFMRNDAECNVITKYSDYADYPYTGECFLQRTNMYTYQPADLQMLEAWGFTKDRFNMDEVKAAYWEAYDMHL